MPSTGSTTARGYGAGHQKRRAAALAALVPGTPCSRCGGPMYRDQALHLDHTDDRSGYRGLSHARCNTSAGGKKSGRRKRRAKRFVGRW